MCHTYRYHWFSGRAATCTMAFDLNIQPNNGIISFLIIVVCNNNIPFTVSDIFRLLQCTWFPDPGLYKPRTGRTGGCVNHAPAILAAPALIYSTLWLLVVWIIVVHFHLRSLLDSYTALEVWTVRRPMRVCCGCRRGRCVLFTNILNSLTVPCLVYNTAMYTVYGRCGQYGRCMVHTLAGAAGVAGAAGAWFIRTQSMLYAECVFFSLLLGNQGT